MRKIGYILFFIGVILAAVFAAPATPLWGYFIFFIILAVVGALIVRFNKVKREKGDENKSKESVTENSMLTNINEISALVEEISKQVNEDKIKMDEAKLRIEEIQNKMMYFVDNKQLIQDSFGTSTYSEIYISFAAGERNLGRSWSAIVDGYPNEAKKSLLTASEGFSESAQLFKKQVNN